MAETNVFSGKIKTSCFLLLCFNFLGLILTLLYNDTIIMDELEHLRASWFVANGEIPYRDFFEHHHPLLWFMFAPVISVLPQQITSTLYIAKSIAFLFSIGSTYVLFQISKRFLGGMTSSIFCLLFYFVYFATWYSFSVFKPDTFMRFFYLFGIYQFFIYADKKEGKNLIYCGLSFTIAFLFLQNIALSILPLIFPLGYLIYKDDKVVFDALKACILPLCLLSAITFWFYSNGTLAPYFELNFIFNCHLFSILHNESRCVILIFCIIIAAAFLASLWIFYQKKSTFYFNTIFLLFLLELLQRTVLFPAVYPHYLVLVFLFGAIILGYTCSLVKSKKTLAWLLILLSVNCFLNFGVIFITNRQISDAYLQEYDKNPQASIVNFDVSLFNVYAPKFDYYWFYPNFEYVDNTLFNRRPEYDINQIIRQHKVEYIAFNPQVRPNFNWAGVTTVYPPAHYWKHHKLDENILQDYEKILPNLFKRKSNQ